MCNILNYRWCTLAVAIFSAVSGAFAWRQTSAAPLQAFAASSVKFVGASGNTAPRIEPGRLIWPRATLRAIIQAAYQVQGYQVSGGPKWLDTDRYEINATAGARVNRDQLMAMLRTLLASRFKLEIHRQLREVAAYALVVGKSGPRFQSLKDGEAPRPGPAGDVVHFRDVAGLAGFLSKVADQPVVDETKLAGSFDITVDMRGFQEGAQEPGNPSGREAFSEFVLAAARDQTGLKLEPRKERVQMLIVDRAEKPGPN